MGLKNLRELRKIAKNASIFMCITLFVVGILLTFFSPATLPLYVEFVKAMGIIIIPLVISIGFNSAVGKMSNVMENIIATKKALENNAGDMGND